jgi:hypothetical protein
MGDAHATAQQQSSLPVGSWIDHGIGFREFVQEQDRTPTVFNAPRVAADVPSAHISERFSVGEH